MESLLEKDPAIRSWLSCLKWNHNTNTLEKCLQPCHSSGNWQKRISQKILDSTVWVIYFKIAAKDDLLKKKGEQHEQNRT